MNYEQRLQEGLTVVQLYIQLNEPIIFLDEQWTLITTIGRDDYTPTPNYMISTHGRIFSLHLTRMMNLSIHYNGYNSVSIIGIDNISQNMKRFKLSVHRLVMLNFKYINNHSKLQVNHIDGCKTNNHINNLEWCNQSENMKHAYVNGLRKNQTGECNHNAKITNEQAHQICQLLTLTGYTDKQIAMLVGCTQKIVNNIKNRYKWLSISKYYDFDSDTIPAIIFNE